MLATLRQTSSLAATFRRRLTTMPKAIDYTERRDARSAKNKKLKSFGPPCNVKLQVLGTGAEGAPRALYVFTTTGSYLFNCGEGTQRLSSERRTRLARLENVFITANAWRNVGGVLGALLTLNDIGVPAITLHGPPGLSSLYQDTRSFIQLRGMQVSHRCDVNTDFVHSGLTVRAVPLLGADVSREVAPADTSRPSSPLADYFAYERTGGGGGADSAPRPQTPADNGSRSPPPPLSDRDVTYAYVCSVPDRPGRLLLELCVKMGVPPGPLLGKLKSGQDVELQDGRTVRSADVIAPPEVGPQFIVLELTSVDFLPSLADLASCVDRSRLAAVVHFSGAAVTETAAYGAWVDSLPARVHHVALNEAGRGLGSEAVHRLQHQLHELDPDLFPLLDAEDSGGPPPLQDEKPSKKVCLSLNGGDAAAATPVDNVPVMSEPGGRLVHPLSGWEISLRPPGEPSTGSAVPVTPDVYREELAAISALAAPLQEYRRAARAAVPRPAAVYPQTVFLGTGSSIPNKKRNTSGILVNLSADHSVLLDCGEGTYGQLVRLLGRAGAARVLRRLGVVFVSHLHADHHIGLIGILEARRRALADSHRPCMLLAPGPIYGYLSMYHNKMAPLKDTFTLVDNACLQAPSSPAAAEVRARLAAAGLTDVATCAVRHCQLAYGVRLRHGDGPTLVYSGDTRPCPRLVELGADCGLLIHEATHEDALQEEAELRAHSTTSEAIEVGRQMRAKHVILTHFSQRYSALPLLPEPAPDNVGVAYDNMVVDYGRLPLLPLLYPSLRQAFAESYDMCVERTARRLDRQQKAAELAAAVAPR